MTEASANASDLRNITAKALSADRLAPSVLIVDDEADLRALLEITLTRMGLTTRSAADLKSARALLEAHNFDLCLTDMRLPDGRGMELVQLIQARYPQTPVAVITAYGNMELAVEALRAGAFDCVSKPVEISQLRGLVNQAIRLRDTPADGSSQRLIGDSVSMRRVKAQVEKLARSQAPVFICGESGTGKEVIARAIHSRGNRADKPFIAVNCGAIPAELMESEFFGHLKGSFSGASQNRSGFFQAAEGGTLFLDEIADMPVAMQVKLLRAIQERSIRPVGAEQEQAVDVRILSASHKSLQREVAEGRFREDLYYRINVIELWVPPLRERREDVPLLVELFLQRIAAQYATASVEPIRISGDALAALTAYTFPGNVRELENILERAAALCEGPRLERHDLVLETRSYARASGSEPGSVLPDPVLPVSVDNDATDERQQLISVLEAHRWNRTAAARQLGLTLRQLRYRIKKFGIG